MRTTLLIPVVNEIRGLKAIMPQTPHVDQVLVVDGGSTDGSVEWCLAQGYEVVRQTGGPGVRQAYLEAWPKVRGDVVVTFSPDGNSDPERLDSVLTHMRLFSEYDMLIVSRYLFWARSEDDTPLTRFANGMLTGLVNLLFGGSYTDALVMYRAYRRWVPEKLGVLDPRSARWERQVGRYISWEPMLSIRAAKAGMRVKELPGHEPARIGAKRPGWLLPESRIHHFRSGVAFLWLIWEEWWRK